MDGSHHAGLFAGYAAAMTGWFLLSRQFQWLRAGSTVHFEHPGRELAWVVPAIIGVLALGQAYSAGFRLPRTGVVGPLLEAFNHLVIFSPFVLLLWFRRHGPETAWIRTGHLPGRLAAGMVLAALAVLAFSLVRTGADPFPVILPRLLRPSNIQYAAQVFLEDFAIAILMVRLVAVVRQRWLAAVMVAGLFAAGHIPALLSQGAAAPELAMLVLDFGLGSCLLWVAQRAADIWWVFLVHYSMDMMQFAFVSGVGQSSG